jgi:hypothetical protein
MINQPRDKDKPKANPQNTSEKKAETTILSPEELRRISGGVQYSPPPPQPGPNVGKKQ